MISIIIPVFNNENSIYTVINQLTEITGEHKLKHEIILVDDGSTKPLNKLKLKTKNIRILQHIKNYGQVPAIFTGLRNMKGEAAIIMSADLQESSEVIPLMISKWQEHYDFVIAQRASREFNLFSFVFYLLINLFTKNKIPQLGYDFGLIDITLVNRIKHTQSFSCFLQILLLQQAKKIAFIEYERTKGVNKKSSWHIFRKFLYAAFAFNESIKNFYLKLAIILACASLLFLLLKVKLLAVLTVLFCVISLTLWTYIYYLNKKQAPVYRELTPTSLQQLLSN